MDAARQAYHSAKRTLDPSELELLDADGWREFAWYGGELLQHCASQFSASAAADRRRRLSALAERLVDSLPPDAALVALGNCVRSCGAGLQLSLCVRLCVRFVSSGGVRRLLDTGAVSGDDDDDDDSSLCRLLLNLPQLAQNRAPPAASVQLPRLLLAPQYQRLLCDVVVQRLLLLGRPTRRCCLLAGLLGFHGHAELLWRSLLSAGPPADSVRQLLAGQSELHVESLLLPLLTRCCSFRLVSDYLGDLLLSSGSARLLVSSKLVFDRQFGHSLAARNAARCLLASDRRLFNDWLLRAARLWSEPAAVRRSSVEQHRHLTWALVVGCRLLAESKESKESPESKESLRSSLLSALVPGIGAHFEHNADEFRLLGAAAGEVLTDLLRLGDDSRRLRFDGEGEADGETRRLLRQLAFGDLDGAGDCPPELLLLPASSEDASVAKEASGDASVAKEASEAASVAKVASEDASVAKEASEDASVVKEASEDASVAKAKAAEEEEEDLDSDDDLVPMAASLAADTPYGYGEADDAGDETRRPRYVRDLLDGLADTGAEQLPRVRACLQSAEQLILAHPAAAAEVGADLLKLLLHLNSEDEAVEGYSRKRLAALVALVCADPGRLAPLLAEQFYEDEFCIAQRLDMLQTLQSAALRLSGRCLGQQPTDSKDSKQPKQPTEAKEAKDSLSSVGKTRRWRRPTTKTKQSKLSSNPFHSHAGSFFFRLARGCDGGGGGGGGGGSRRLDLAGADHLLLCRLLYCLGVVYFCSERAPLQPKLLAELLRLLPGFESHPEATVRRGALFCRVVVGMATPGHLLLPLCLGGGGGGEADGERLRLAAGEDPDAECRQLAACAAAMMQQRLAAAAAAGDFGFQ